MWEEGTVVLWGSDGQPRYEEGDWLWPPTYLMQADSCSLGYEILYGENALRFLTPSDSAGNAVGLAAHDPWLHYHIDLLI